MANASHSSSSGHEAGLDQRRDRCRDQAEPQADGALHDGADEHRGRQDATTPGVDAQDHPRSRLRSTYCMMPPLR